MRFTVPEIPHDLHLTPSLTGPAGDEPRSSRADVPHHGARDGRQAARGRSERDHAKRARSASGGRSYAFRRS